MNKYTAEAFYVAKEINLDKVSKKLEQKPLIKRREFLIYELNKNEFVFVFNYGSIVFFNIARDAQENFKKLISKYYKNPLKKVYSEIYTIMDGGKDDSIFSAEAILRKVEQEEIEIVSRILAQS